MKDGSGPPQAARPGNDRSHSHAIHFEIGQARGLAGRVMSAADRKANIAAGRASARRNPEPMLVEEHPSGGFQFWKVGDVLVGMPALLPSAPARVRRNYRDRLLSNALGECPRCESIAGDPVEDSGLAPFPHRTGCPVIRTDFEPWIRRAAA